MPAARLTEQARKLGLREGARVAIIGADLGWELVDAPPLVMVADGEPADMVLLFLRAAAELRRVAPAGESVRPGGAVWVAWPRRAGGHTSDLGDAVIRESVLPLGLVDVKVAAIDDDWSGLKFVWRLSERAIERGAK
jgi:hypothetical protein